MELCVFYTLLVSVLHLNYTILTKLLEQYIKPHGVYIYGGCTIVISCINIYVKPSFYMTEQSILYSVYGTILNYIILSSIGFLNAFSIIVFNYNLEIYPYNPAK